MKLILSELAGNIRHSVFLTTSRSRNGRQRKRFLLSNLALHFRPTTVPATTLKFTHTWGLGGMAAVLVMLQLFTGVLLKFVYAPTPTLAYQSVLSLQNDIMFGKLIRNIHYLSANFLVMVVFLHLLRVFLTGAFHKPRQFNWVVGLSLFALILSANFTGYLLPWDQLAFWAITICTGMLEYIPVVGPWLRDILGVGSEIGAASLKIFYGLHTAIIPILIIGLMSFHFWRVRKAGGVVIPRSHENDMEIKVRRIPTVPNLVLRELVVALILIAAILLFSVFFNAPLGKPANPGLSPNPTQAPWYFAGLQELLLYFHPFFAVTVIPLLCIGMLIILPYIRYERETAGIWFGSESGRRASQIAAMAALVITPATVLMHEYFFDYGKLFSSWPPIVADGFVPFSFCAVVICGFLLFIRKTLSLSRDEVIQALFIFSGVSLILLTIIGVWFRGPFMMLAWPW